MNNTGVIATEKSSNKKIGDVSCTYVAQQSCPSSCPFQGNGCYAEAGMVGMHTRSLNKTNLDPITLARNEAAAINSLSGKRDLRLHVVGDCVSNEAANIVSRAAKAYVLRGSKRVWSYTHAFGAVQRGSWGDSVSILASTESIASAKMAMDSGYAAAIVIPQHLSTKAYVVEGIKVIPCPEQTGKASSCTTCRLCWDDKRLMATKSVIAFQAHSQGINKLKKALVNISNG